MGYLDRQEALAVMHDIYDECKETVIMNSVSLDAKQAAGAVGYQIRIKCDLDDVSRQCLENVFGKHNLSMREENGYVLVF